MAQWKAKRNKEHDQILNKSVHILSKEEIEKITSQCTPPNKITTKHGENKLFISAPVDSHYVIHKRSNDTEL